MLKALAGIEVRDACDIFEANFRIFKFNIPSDTARNIKTR